MCVEHGKTDSQRQPKIRKNRKTDRQTNIFRQHTDRKTDRQTDRQTDRHTYRKTDSHRLSQAAGVQFVSQKILMHAYSDRRLTAFELEKYIEYFKSSYVWTYA